MGGAAIEGPILGSILRKRLVLSGTTLRARSNDYKAELVGEFAKNALPLFAGAAPRLKPIVDRVFPLEKVVDSHIMMESNANTGKIVLLVDGEMGARSDL
jgi:NADPH:quinone reductase-like Zn-dependent oxidoreductase